MTGSNPLSKASAKGIRFSTLLYIFDQGLGPYVGELQKPRGGGPTDFCESKFTESRDRE